MTDFKPMTLRLVPEEDAQLRVMAGLAGLSKAKYVRDAMQERMSRDVQRITGGQMDSVTEYLATIMPAAPDATFGTEE